MKGVPPRVAEFEVSPQAVEGLLSQSQGIEVSRCFVIVTARDRALVGKSLSRINSSEGFVREEAMTSDVEAAPQARALVHGRQL